MSIRKLHLKAGLMAGLLLFILSLTGFFLNHDQWKFQYQWTVENSILPDSVALADKKLIQFKTTRPGQTNWVIVGGLRGAFLSKDSGHTYQLTSNHQFYALRWLNQTLYAATEDGIKASKDYGVTWQPFALEGMWVNALATDGHKFLASVDKQLLVVLDITGKVIQEGRIDLKQSETAKEINLSRFVRDFHYGRGLLDDGWSLWINDVAAWILIFSVISGLWIWMVLRKAKKDRLIGRQKKYVLNRVIQLHSHTLVLVALPVLVLFAMTGVVLDHSRFFNKPLKQITWSIDSLPPIYHSLREDIWSVDIEQNAQYTTYRVGNRYGVYQSADLKAWKKVSNGFAYRMNRLNDTLYVSGMGAPSRTYTKTQGWQIFKAPHMFKNPYQLENKLMLFGGHGKQADHQVPKLTDSTFYSIMLTLHDGTFFSTWWVWVNDLASFLLVFLLITGLIRWYKRR